MKQILRGKYFITGTGTEVGKTFITAKLLKIAADKGHKAVGLKPVASGAENGINQDAMILSEASNVSLEYKQINPICFEPPIAPHIAAQQCHQPLTVDSIAQPMLEVLAFDDIDLFLIEGAGGWCVPINEQHMWADVVQYLDIPVILVVGMTLGCINHALLTERAILADNCALEGWIVNPIDKNMLYYQENLATLKQKMRSPYLGTPV